jgi:TonB family protein
VTLAFEIDDHGRPSHFEVLKSSLDLWGLEAANMVSNWQFAPGTKEGLPVPVRCTVDLVWGAETLSAATVAAQLNALHPPAAAPAAVVRPTPQVAPVALEQSPPAYADRARDAGLEGVMWVTFNVGEDGTPRDIKVTEHLALGLDEQAILAISKWRFRPALLNGQPVSAPAVTEVFFQLSGVTAALVQPNLPAVTRAAPRPVPQK